MRAATYRAAILVRLTSSFRVLLRATTTNHEDGRLRHTPRSSLSSRKLLNTWLKKVALVVSLASLIGVLDDLQVRYFKLENFGNETYLVYQFCFLAASAAVAYGVLHTKDWSIPRNLSNLLMAIPIAAMADNVSIDAGTLRPYVILIPRQGYVWRQAVFGHTVALAPVASWVNSQSIAPSLLNGYVASILLVAAYIIVQFVWIRRDRLGIKNRKYSRNPPN